MQTASVASIIVSPGSHSAGASQTRVSKSKSAEENLQEVFSAVLESVGREGFKSAEKVQPEQPLEQTSLEQEMSSSWDQWFDQLAPSRYQFEFNSGNPSVRQGKTAADLKADYGKILTDAYHEGGYATPGTFLKGLSKEELQTIQQVHHLADPIDVGSLSEESSLNLLLPPDTQVDANRDGLTAVGAAYSLRFPDSNTPREIRKAWEVATENMPEGERMTYELQMTFPLIAANMHTDSEGHFLSSSNPGDADWVNPMASANFSYNESAKSWLEYLDRFRNQIPPEQYSRDKKFWTSFRDQLEKTSAVL